MADMDNMITSAEAVKMINESGVSKVEMSLHAFRKAATTQKELKEARVMVHKSLALYDKDKVLEWAKTAKRRRRQPRS
jgi:hypothetical protein